MSLNSGFGGGVKALCASEQFRTRRQKMKIRIDKAACVGNARCWAVSQELFTLDEDGYIEVEAIDVPPGMEDLARRGARACPERVIEIVEDE
jgi:ferredoxin